MLRQSGRAARDEAARVDEHGLQWLRVAASTEELRQRTVCAVKLSRCVNARLARLGRECGDLSLNGNTRRARTWT